MKDEDLAIDGDLEIMSMKDFLKFYCEVAAHCIATCIVLSLTGLALVGIYRVVEVLLPWLKI